MLEARQRLRNGSGVIGGVVAVFTVALPTNRLVVDKNDVGLGFQAMTPDAIVVGVPFGGHGRPSITHSE